MISVPPDDQGGPLANRLTESTGITPMPKRSRAELAQSREKFVAARAEVTERYQGGESAASLSRFFGDVGEKWLAERLDEWGIPRRDRSAAAVPRGPGVPPLYEGARPDLTSPARRSGRSHSAGAALSRHT